MSNLIAEYVCKFINLGLELNKVQVHMGLWLNIACSIDGGLITFHVCRNKRETQRMQAI